MVARLYQLKEQDLQSQSLDKLYTTEPHLLSKRELSIKNGKRLWKYGYDEESDLVVISKTGQVGDIYNIQGLRIGLPLFNPKDKLIIVRSKKKSEQYWERTSPPKAIDQIKTIFQWNDKPKYFKDLWVPYVENEFDRRERGVFFANNGKPTYITGSHYMYLQWCKIDVGYADFREANRILFIYWAACQADNRSYGMNYVKIRRSGFSFMSASNAVDIGTISKNARIGILSKTGADAKKMFTDKVVPMNTNLPFFFKPIMDGMDKPKTELAYRIPAAKITKKNMTIEDDGEYTQGLDTTIDWRNTDNNSYDGEKLQYLVHDESGKYLKPNDIKESWRVQKTCLRLGKKIIGKCMMGSTVNAQNKGGKEFKDMYFDSDLTKRNSNGQTKSGLYKIFIPMEFNLEGFIDRYGMPVINTPPKPVLGVDNEMIDIGAVEYWEGEVDSLKGDASALNEFYRQFPRTESHAFRNESKQSLFNLTKINEQIDYNDGNIESHHVTSGNFTWKDGIKDTEVIFSPQQGGRFRISWTPEKRLTNLREKRNGIYYPVNEHLGAFGCDSYDISGTVGGGGSKGSLHGLTKFNMDNAPSNEFFLEYISRPQTAEIFFEDVLMACVFYGMPILAENNKPRLLYHFKNRGYRGYSMNRPDKHYTKLSKSEKELGGIPNSSEDVKQIHAASIEAYIEKYVGYDYEGLFRDSEDIGMMPFNRTLIDWAEFDINNRTKFDASISSGLAILACQKHLYKAEKKDSKISVNFARYNNTGNNSQRIT